MIPHSTSLDGSEWASHTFERDVNGVYERGHVYEALNYGMWYWSQLKLLGSIHLSPHGSDINNAVNAFERTNTQTEDRSSSVKIPSLRKLHGGLDEAKSLLAVLLAIPLVRCLVAPS